VGGARLVGEIPEGALDAGMRWGDVQTIRHAPILARYILKLPLAPLDLDLDGKVCMELHLALYGGEARPLVTPVLARWP
jgi:hypothetical protein